MVQIEPCEECNNRFQILFNRLFFMWNSNKKLLTRKEAYDSTTYGRCMDREQFIKKKQIDINSSIREKTQNSQFTDTEFEKYFLIVSFNKVEEDCASEVFKPFRDDGYTIIKLSDTVDVLKGNNVYLISWKS